MAVMSISFGQFAIEFDTAELMADALLSECHNWSGDVPWLRGTEPASLSDLLVVWDELASSPALKNLNPFQQQGGIPHPALLLPQVGPMLTLILASPHAGRLQASPRASWPEHGVASLS
jgi:hypothetical protein